MQKHTWINKVIPHNITTQRLEKGIKFQANGEHIVPLLTLDFISANGRQEAPECRDASTRRTLWDAQWAPSSKSKIISSSQ